MLFQLYLLPSGLPVVSVDLLLFLFVLLLSVLFQLCLSFAKFSSNRICRSVDSVLASYVCIDFF